MEKVIILEDVRRKNLMEECKRLKEELKQAQISAGYSFRENGRNFILQDITPKFGNMQGDQTTNLNNFSYVVDNSLVIDGWNPCGVIPLDENYFTSRKDSLSRIGFSEIREERSEYRGTGEPCVAFYGRNNN